MVGSFQQSAIASHLHSVPGALSGWGLGKFDMFGSSKGDVEYPSKGTNTNETGGAETRPVNVALYYYIKIN